MLELGNGPVLHMLSEVNMSTNSGGHALLSVVRCSVHGLIDLEDVTPDTAVIKQLVVSAPVQRLRRIKQLGFASLTFTGADHSRFSHAVGTMHVMRRMLNATTGRPYIRALAAGLTCGLGDSTRSAHQHMLVAALLQDCGELPYACATVEAIRPSEEVLLNVQDLIGEDASTWPSKSVFNLACLYELQNTLVDYDIRTLAYLITGHHWRTQRPEIHAAMRLLDGVVDADRIDYVARDAHHTGLGRVDLNAVIDSILDFDVEGPIFSDPTHVASLLALRAHLYSTVYYSAPNRFRVMLLKGLLEGVLSSPDADLRRAILEADYASINYPRFLELDDVELEKCVVRAANPLTKNRLASRARTAVEVLAGTRNDYRAKWLMSTPPAPDDAKVQIPPAVFAEFYEVPTTSVDQPVRIELGDDGGLVDLTTLNGPYSRVVADPRAELPIRGDVLVFEPTTLHKNEAYNRAGCEGWLGAGLKSELIATGSIANPDTRNTAGFYGPSIFISYCVDDIALVSAVAAELHRRRRQYLVYAGAFQGLGGTPGGNSMEAPSVTDACIVIASPAYQERLTGQPNGNIAKEVSEVVRRVIGGVYPIVALSTVDFAKLDRMPWRVFGFDEPPFVGSPLDSRSKNLIVAAVDAALERIDRDVKLLGS